MQDRVEGRKVCVLENAAMEIPVEGGQLQFVTHPCRRHHLLEQLVQIPDQRPARRPHHTRHAVSFDLLAKAEHFDCFVFGAFRDLRASPPLSQHESLLL